MFSFIKRKRFEPEFPIIDLAASADEVMQALSAFSPVEREEDSSERDIDYSYVSHDRETRISVGFSDERIVYVNYLTSRFNKNAKQRAEKLNWFLNHYGGMNEFDSPNDTGYMLFFNNPKRKLSIVFGLHKGSIRINNHDRE